ncbi:hypothetical protein [Streptomyces virginiae]|uniref:hypothetical protein n=1 Tax=Streptomyces virginiae TaxID=1961 RepID=UPI003252D830
MEIPQLTVTLAGGTNTGKTTFMHGMYARLSAGFHDYFLYTIDPDDDVDLQEAWERLLDTGDVPRGGQAPQEYAFRFARQLTPLLDMTWTDFRGGAAYESGRKADAQPDIEQWKEHLPKTDSLYVVLDGEALGTWVKEGAEEGANFSSGRMGPARLSQIIRAAHAGRTAANNPPPSIVLLITKMDMLSVASGMSTAKAFKTATLNMRKLLSPLFEQGMTTLVCPVQIGTFKRSQTENGRVDPSLIRPQYLHVPICFSLWYYLTETLRAQEQQLVGAQVRLTVSQEMLAELRSKSLLLGKRKKILSAEASALAQQAEKSAIEDGINTRQTQADQMMATFENFPIIKDGKIYMNWPEDNS